MSLDKVAAQYPRSVTLASGARIELRLMTVQDRDAVLAFARGLPQEDLLFLRVDLTEPEVVDDWMVRMQKGQSTTIVAFDQANLVGYATVHRETAPWTRRIGELRVNVGPAHRGQGLGRILTSNIYDVAQLLGLRKLVAHMTVDQHGAQAAFRSLGFVPEALLADYVEDRNGRARDLVIMSHDLDGLNDFMAAPLRAV